MENLGNCLKNKKIIKKYEKNLFNFCLFINLKYFENIKVIF